MNIYGLLDSFFFFKIGVNECYANIVLGFVYLILIFLSVLVIISENPVYCVLSLVGVFLFSIIIMILLKVEFLAFMFLVVYVGAIAVFFLFIVMMVNFKMQSKLDFGETIAGFLLLSFLFFGFVYLFPIFFSDVSFETIACVNLVKSSLDVSRILGDFSIYESFSIFTEITAHDWTNIEQIGMVLYTHYVIAFLLCGVVLLVSILGCVLLTAETKIVGLKKQDLNDQLLKKYMKTVIKVSN